IASVISSSPRPDGARPATASCTAGVNRYTPTRARSLLGRCGFSSRPISWPAPSSSATPNCRGSSTAVSMIWASGLDARNSSTSPVMPPTMKLSPRYITKSSSPRNSLATRTACASPRGCLPDVGHFQPERVARTDRRTDGRLRVADHDPHLGDSGVADRLQAIEQHGLVRHGDQLLGRGVGDRPKPRPRSSGQDEGFHGPEAYRGRRPPSNTVYGLVKTTISSPDTTMREPTQVSKLARSCSRTTLAVRMTI